MGWFSKPKCEYFDCDRDARYTCSTVSCRKQVCSRHCFGQDLRCWVCVDSPARRQVLRELGLHPITAERLDRD